jgi:transcriptional regulator GlxA family with amidase domain
VPAVATLALGGEARQALIRGLPSGGAWRLVSCAGIPQLEQTLLSQLVDAIVFPPHRIPFAALTSLRQSFPNIPWIAFGPFRPDDGLLLLAAVTGGVALALVEGVDNAVAGELVARHSATALRRGALAGADRALRLTDPLQQQVWAKLLERPDRPVRTTQLAALVGYTREHLSREFGAGGAPNLKRVIDLTRVVCAASLLANPGYDARAVARILRFASASHLTATARRIAGVPASRLADMGVSDIVTAFARGATRSRL